MSLLNCINFIQLCLFSDSKYYTTFPRNQNTKPRGDPGLFSTEETEEIVELEKKILAAKYGKEKNIYQQCAE
jgi:hypothetical protein